MIRKINKISFARIPKAKQSKDKFVKAVFNHVIKDCKRNTASIDNAMECIDDLNNIILSHKIRLQLLNNHK
ncbi:hypothetical protein [Xanthomarina sp. F2636L]|uniref:hypothetical protein n=1 Tax=Xanthomarina sp. F2636L TaxID=2996018 RepID=UPI00225E1E56|nr:hypothetical protein [Xanthomarina sp. F2636L]MCX7551888.1 hypothetical protein [Xanthomarina sp. F2636L]